MKILNHLPKSMFKLHQSILPISAKGSYIYTKNNKYLDLTAGIGALSTGHNHPLVINKVKDQLNNYVHFQQQLFQSHPIQIELTGKLLNTFENKKIDNILYLNSGSEATDNAIKIARNYTGKSNIIAMNKGFHGRTIGALSVTSSNLNCKKGISPLLSNVYFCHDFTKSSINTILDFQSAPEDTAAIIFESIQGEGGINDINEDFLKYLETICKKNDILLIADEVQCGSMRTGTFWDYERKNIKPDIVTFGKGISSGFQLAGVASNSNIMNRLPSGSLGGTYGGNAISSAAAVASIDIINTKEIQDNVNSMGNYIYNNIKNHSLIKNVNQYGLMIGIEFYDINTSSIILNILREKGILVLMAGNKNQFIRLLPPLNISKKEADIFIDTMNNISKLNIEAGY